MSDLISKTDVALIESSADAYQKEWNEDYERVFGDAITAVLKLPAAEPECKTARWIEDGYSHYKAVCSECGEPCATYVVNTPRDRFCKWCGAKMEVDT